MNPDLYRAAKNGEIEAFKRTKSELELHKLLTPDNNTVLHIHITSLRTDGETPFVEEILNLCPALLLQPNAVGDIPLHVAARYGHDRLVRILIERAAPKADHCEDIESADKSSDSDIKAAKEMLRTRNSVKDTALHEAVRFGHIEVVKVLVENDQCGYQYGANDDGETPLYIAAERRHREIVGLILDKCTSLQPETGGPCGRTVLHAAVLWNDYVMTRKVLEKARHLTKRADDRGWVPLHFAAHNNCVTIAKYLLKCDRDAAYIKNKKGRTALHLAASFGYHKMMTEILSSCPDCSELVDDRRWNALHFAVKADSIPAVNVILDDSSLSNLLNGKDIEGNTPLHIATALGHKKTQKSLLTSLSRRVDKMAFNNKNQNAFDIAMITVKNGASLMARLNVEGVLAGGRIGIYVEEEDVQNFNNERNRGFDLEKVQESTLVVATLIATMTFAAGFTLPGGYVSNDGPLQGSAILSRNAAFQAFMVTDTLAMVLSSVSVLIQFFSISRQGQINKAKHLTKAYYLTMSSMGAMVIAFVTGTYAVLAPSVALAVATCVIGLSFFVFFYMFFKKTFG